MDEIVKMVDTRMKEYEEKLQKVTPASSQPHPDIVTLSQDFQNFKTYVWKTLSLFKSHIELSSLAFERHEAYLRKKVLLFHGVPEKPSENLRVTIANILNSHMNLSDVSVKDLQVCHRLGVGRDKLRPVLVRFYDIQKRHLVWDNKTSLKGSGITISEFLTISRHNTFLKARKHFGLKNCWTSDGKIIILLPDKRRCKVETTSELQDLITKHPSKDNVSEPADILPNIDEKAYQKSPRRKRKH